MGLCILGIKINDIEKYNEEETIVTRSHPFHRGLTKDEERKVDFANENYEVLHDDFGMSYGNYNGFRDELSRCALNLTSREVWGLVSSLDIDDNYPEAIYHLINFSDCEGFIGPKAVKELDLYFKENYDRIYSKMEERTKDLENYYTNRLKTLVECIDITAKNNGYLMFC